MKYIPSFIIAAALLVASTYAEDPWTPSPLCPFPSEDLTRFPFEGDCSKYWECYEGARYPMDCPNGLEFNAAVSRCDTPQNANCDPDATIIYPTFSHSTSSTTTSEPTPDPGPKPECPFPSDELTFFPVANNCSQYWECFQGNRYLMTCPSGLYWNQLAGYCDYAGNVDCNTNVTTTTSGPSTTTTTTPGNDTTTESPVTGWTPDPLCPYPSDELTFFPHPTNCSLYYECYEGNKFLMTCQDGLYWNELANVCDYKENVNCDRNTSTSTGTPGTGTTTEPGTTVTGPTTTESSLCVGLPDGTYLADPDDCSKFFECVSGKVTEGQCPGDLVWNVDAHTCDYAWNVVCNNTVHLSFH